MMKTFYSKHFIRAISTVRQQKTIKLLTTSSIIIAAGVAWQTHQQHTNQWTPVEIPLTQALLQPTVLPNQFANLVSHRTLAIDPPIAISSVNHSISHSVPNIDSHSASAVVNKIPKPAPALTGPVVPTVSYAAAPIHGSLAKAVQNAGLNKQHFQTLTGIFHDVADLNHLRTGDRFAVLYQQPVKTNNAEKKTNSSILAAELTVQGKVYRAIRYTDLQGNISYYTPEGISLHPGFLRAPVNYTRIGSGFSERRLDPILGEYRAHPAVDFAAPIGTPIKATGPGKVLISSYQGGYGNMIKLQHPGNVTTLYGHLSRFAQGVKPGAQVKVGQVIGYVGQTGMATGPHVHYEIAMNGVRHNALTVKLPGSPPLNKAAMAKFSRFAHQMLAQLDLNQRIMLAANDVNSKPHG